MNSTTHSSSPSKPSRPMDGDPLTSDLVAANRLRTIESLRDGLEHQLRSPLNAIVLNVELLKELVRAEGGTSAVLQLERLDAISSSLARLQCGLAELLSLASEPDETRTRFDLGQLVGEVAAMVGEQARQMGLRLEAHKPEQPLPVRARREALRQALAQLLINALEASPSGGQVTLTARHHDGAVLVEVRDEGPGVPREARERLFDRSTSGEPGRHGLGLYVARKLIDDDDGELTLAEPGPQGTVFRARFPEDRS